MAHRVSWQDRYAFVTQTSTPLFDSSNITAPAAGTFGVKRGKHGWDVLGHPSLQNNQQVIFNKKAYGISQRYSVSESKEFQQGVFQAGGSFEWQHSAGVTIPWLWTLFQSGTSVATVDTASKWQYTFIPYSLPDIEMVNNVYRKMNETGDANSNSHRMAGCIAKSMQFTTGENDVVKVSMEAIAYHFATTIDWDAVFTGTLGDFDSTNVLLWQDATVTLDTETVLLPGLDVTITNNASQRFYNSENAQRYILGDLEVSGSIKLPWDAHPDSVTPGVDQGLNKQLTDFQAGTDKLLAITWGTGGNDNYLSLEMNIRYQTPDIETGDNEEIGWNLPFIGVYDGTNNAVRIKVTESDFTAHRGVP